MLLAGPPKYIQNLTASHHVHIFYPGPSHHISRWDYCSSLLSGFSASTPDPLQLVSPPSQKVKPAKTQVTSCPSSGWSPLKASYLTESGQTPYNSLYLSPLTVCFSGSHTQLRLWVIVCLFFHCITSGKGFASVWWWGFYSTLVGSLWKTARRYPSWALSLCQPFVSLLIFVLTPRPFPNYLFCSV